MNEQQTNRLNEILEELQAHKNALRMQILECLSADPIDDGLYDRLAEKWQHGIGHEKCLKKTIAEGEYQSSFTCLNGDIFDLGSVIGGRPVYTRRARPTEINEDEYREFLRGGNWYEPPYVQ